MNDQNAAANDPLADMKDQYSIQPSVIQFYILIRLPEYQKKEGCIFSTKKGGKRFYIYHMKIN